MNIHIDVQVNVIRVTLSSDGLANGFASKHIGPTMQHVDTCVETVKKLSAEDANSPLNTH